jgi:hypothetical protein
MIPMKDQITVVKPQGFDRWGEPLGILELQVKCRIDLTVDSKKTPVGNGDEEVYSGVIHMKGLVDVGYEDTLEWTDEFGEERSEKPLKIVPIKDFGGKVILTKVLI